MSGHGLCSKDEENPHDFSCEALPCSRSVDKAATHSMLTSKHLMHLRALKIA